MVITAILLTALWQSIAVRYLRKLLKNYNN